MKRDLEIVQRFKEIYHIHGMDSVKGGKKFRQQPDVIMNKLCMMFMQHNE